MKEIQIAAYIRVSSEEQAKLGDSLRAQQERCLNYIHARTDARLQGVYMDDGVSGQKLDRCAFDRLMAKVREGAVDLIVFTKLDRWFRSLRHYLNTQAVLEQFGVAWLAIDQPYFDTSSPHGRAFVNQSMMWAELEAQNGSQRIRDVFQNKVRYGEVISGKVPMGYDIQNKHLIPNSQAPVVTELFSYFLCCQSLQKTLDHLKDEYGLIMSMDNLKRSVLQNSKYMGLFRDNDHYCPPLVEQRVFMEVQRILQSRQNVRSNQIYSYLFSQLLICRHCGHRMYGCQIHVTRKNKYRYQYPAYACPIASSRQDCCNCSKIRESKIETALLEQVSTQLNGWSAKYLIQEPERINRQNRRLRIKKKLDRLKQLYLHGMLELSDYERERQLYLIQLQALDKNTETVRDLSLVSQLLQMNFQDLYAGFTNEEKRRLWRSVLGEIQMARQGPGQYRYTFLFL